jgi:hypothetical protein
VKTLIYTQTESIPARLVERVGSLFYLEGFREQRPSGKVNVEIRDGDSTMSFEGCEVVDMDHSSGKLTLSAANVRRPA